MIRPIILTGPYFNNTARKRRRKRIQVALLLAAVALLTLFLAHSLRAIVRNADAQIRIERTSWLSYEEQKQLARFHGVGSLWVQNDNASIFRNKKWIVVKRRGE